MIYHVEELLAGTDAAGECGMRNDSDAPPDELVELGETAVRTYRHDDGDGREVVSLAQHAQLHDSLEVAGFLLETRSDRLNP